MESGNLCGVYIENYRTNQLVKKIENRSTFAKVIIKHQWIYFFETQCIFRISKTFKFKYIFKTFLISML